MKHFPRVLREILRENSLSQTEAAVLTGLDQVKIYRLANGVSRPEADGIRALLQAFPEPEDRFRLLLAHIQDELPPEAFQALQIQLAQPQNQLRDLPSVAPDHLSKRARAAIAFLIEETRPVPSIADAFISFAICMGWDEKLPTPGLAKGTARKVLGKVKALNYPPDVCTPQTG